MLLEFTVKNFRSFKGEQTFSMVASNRQPDHSDHLITIPESEAQALPVAAIYGANGAGKSNLVKALQFLQELLTKGTEPKKPIGRQAFKLDKESAGQSTEFRVQFVEGGHVYVFGCKVNDSTVVEEWLSLIQSGKEIEVYERLTMENMDVKIEPGIVLKFQDWGDHDKALAFSKIGVLPNQLFLQVLGKTLKEEDQGPIIKGALQWFTERLIVISPSSAYTEFIPRVAQDEDFKDFMGEYLRKTGTDVDRLAVESENLDTAMVKPFDNFIGTLPDGVTTTLTNPDGSDIEVEKGEKTTIRVRTVQAEHLTAEGERVRFPFKEESDGTQRLTHLLPTLHSIRLGPKLYVIDEIDRSLHPLLAKGFVRDFLRASVGKGSQLMFTTHETAFLDLDLLRRDEIWFAEKKPPVNATELYSLADFKVRTDLKIDKAYLQGRFEAIPPIDPELPDWVQEIMKELQPRRSGESSLSPK